MGITNVSSCLSPKKSKMPFCYSTIGAVATTLKSAKGSMFYCSCYSGTATLGYGYYLTAGSVDCAVGLTQTALWEAGATWGEDCCI